MLENIAFDLDIPKLNAFNEEYICSRRKSLFLLLGTQLGVEGRIEAMTLSFFGGGGQNYGNPNL